MAAEGAVMLACNRLRIDPCDGSTVAEYRIDNGCVESRTLETVAEFSTATDQRWQRLTPEQLTSHVLANTVLAQWLGRRMGVHRLVRACTESDERRCWSATFETIFIDSKMVFGSQTSDLKLRLTFLH